MWCRGVTLRSICRQQHLLWPEALTQHSYARRLRVALKLVSAWLAEVDLQNHSHEAYHQQATQFMRCPLQRTPNSDTTRAERFSIRVRVPVVGRGILIWTSHSHDMPCYHSHFHSPQASTSVHSHAHKPFKPFSSGVLWLLPVLAWGPRLLF